ncbi:unnamed protein product, partial [Amoebophrya sp. A25]
KLVADAARLEEKIDSALNEQAARQEAQEQGLSPEQQETMTANIMSKLDDRLSAESQRLEEKISTAATTD